MLSSVFSVFTMSAVQKVAQSIVVEVHRQLPEITGIMECKTDSDYATCDSLCTKGVRPKMEAPAVLTVIAPRSPPSFLAPPA